MNTPKKKLTPLMKQKIISAALLAVSLLLWPLMYWLVFLVPLAILGWFGIVAAVIIVLAGRARLRRFVAWFEQSSQTMIRVWLLFGIAFGAFLVYGVV